MTTTCSSDQNFENGSSGDVPCPVELRPRGGSTFVMLRRLEAAVVVGGESLVQRGDQLLHVAMSAQLSEPIRSVAKRAGDPSQGHLPVAPSLDIARVVRDRAVEVLDRVGGAQRVVQRPGDA